MTIERALDVSPEHADAYSEMCNQFKHAVLVQYSAASKLTIMRELPVAYQLNAVIVGSIVGALVPLLSMTKPSGDALAMETFADRLPEIFAQARKTADEVMAFRR